MTVVIGTAGHIDHGKTSLLRALTGIDADRLPEEQRRGMTIDVGYAHMRLDDGSEIDFVDVPGHDRLIGNMLVGAGEIDAAMLVVAADDGPRAQTIEHLDLLDALGIRHGLAAVTKTDLVPADRLAEVQAQVHDLLAATSLSAAQVIPVSSVTGWGLEALRSEIRAVRESVAAGAVTAVAPRLAIDRVFSVRGRGVVVTGSLRGGGIARGDVLRVEPVGLEIRVREIQAHNKHLDRFEGGGRVALNLAGVERDALRRGFILTTDATVERTDRVLVLLRPGSRGDLRHGQRVRLHIGTDQVDGTLDLGRRASAATGDGSITAIARLARPIAAAIGDPFILRRPSPGETLAGGRILDPLPPRAASRRRVEAATLARLAGASWGSRDQIDALVALHGAVPAVRAAALAVATGGRGPVATAGVVLAPDVVDALEAAAPALVAASGSASTAELRAGLVAETRRRVTLDRIAAAAVADTIVERLTASGLLVRDGDRILPEGSRTGPSAALLAAMDRLAASLAVPAPPSLREAATAAGCPPEGVRALEAAGRIVRVEDDLAWEAASLRGYEEQALRMAAAVPLSPAAFRDATGTSRRYALAILEHMDRMALLRRTPAGHVPGPRAAAVAPSRTG